MKLQAVLIALGGIMLSVACAAVMWLWPLSPYQRLAAYVTIRTNTASSVPELIHAAQTAVGKPDATMQQLGEILPAYGISASTNTVSQAVIELPFSNTDIQDDSLIKDKVYTFPQGITGSQYVDTKQVVLNGIALGEYTQNGAVISTPVDQVTFLGTKDTVETVTALNTQWKQVVTAANKKDTATLQTLLAMDDEKEIANLLKLSDLSYRLQAKAGIVLVGLEQTPTTLQVGTVTLTNPGCSVTGIVPILYLKASHTYVFDNVYAILASMCAKPKPANPKTGSTLTCSNCWLAPVSKSYGLPSTYAPTVVATGLTGGGAVTPETKAALVKLFAAAQARGMKPHVTSSYRSYQVQVTLFNSYVADEKAKGLSTAKATEKANTYSAKPGHSEHQLGTTADVTACDKTYCTFDDPKNNAFYQFVHDNAYKYGFIISYPNGSQPYTGYVYEPWHIRYIGVTLATELYNKGYLTKKGFYLYQFLLQKGLY